MTDDDRANVGRPSAVPAWHPLALVGLVLLVSSTGILLSASHHEVAGVPGPRIVGAYVPMLFVSWGLLLYVCRVGRARFEFTELAGLRAYTPARAAGDVALALTAALVILGGEALWHAAFENARSAAVELLLPSTPAERAVWCVVAVSVGVSEEVVYRGYLATELARFTSSSSAGVLGQALLFAFAHADQGAGTALRFFCYAAGLGALARVRRSLMPGILAHVGLDLLAGLTR